MSDLSAPSPSAMIRAVMAPEALAKRSISSQDFVAEFCGSISRRVDRGYALSDKQAALLSRLYIETTDPAAAPRGTALDSAGLDTLRGMFRAAAEAGLKRPRITVQVEGIKLHLSRAPETGRNPGSLYVRAFGEYAGKIAPDDSAFLPVQSAPEGVARALACFAADPAAVAAASGHETGHCSFCGLVLSDARSVKAGFGPICAEKYGLADAWANAAKPARAARKRAA